MWVIYLQLRVLKWSKYYFLWKLIILCYILKKQDAIFTNSAGTKTRRKYIGRLHHLVSGTANKHTHTHTHTHTPTNEFYPTPNTVHTVFELYKYTRWTMKGNNEGIRNCPPGQQERNFILIMRTQKRHWMSADSTNSVSYVFKRILNIRPNATTCFYLKSKTSGRDIDQRQPKTYNHEKAGILHFLPDFNNYIF